MNGWLFILMILGLIVLWIFVIYIISECLRLNNEQTTRLINATGPIMCIIGFCLGLYFGNRLIW